MKLLKKLLAVTGVVMLLSATSAFAEGNPCAGHNPCAMKANPCAMKSNPCAAKNPCAMKSNPCAVKKHKKHKKAANPCAGHNPCAMHANPCAAKK